MDPILLKADILLVGEKLEVKKHHGLLIEGQNIESIAPYSILIQEYPDAIVVDFENMTILPGLFDCHNHLNWDNTIPNYVDISQGSEALLSIIGANNVKKDLYSGVTSSRYMGGHYYLDVKFRDFIEKRMLQGPKIKAAGLGLRSSAGHGYLADPSDGIDEIINAVRTNLLKNVDWIKFYITGNSLNRQGIPSTYYTRQEIELIIDISHRAGIPTTAHCNGGIGMTDAIEAGIDCLEHCYFTDERQIELILKNNIWVCLTMSEFFTVKEFMPSEMAANYKKFAEKVRHTMQQLIKSGVNCVLGTDGMHGSLWNEAYYYVENGGSNKDAVISLTVNAAKLLGMFEETGSIATGKRADLVVTHGNPLQDISFLKDVYAVFQNGELITIKDEQLNSDTYKARQSKEINESERLPR